MKNYHLLTGVCGVSLVMIFIAASPAFTQGINEKAPNAEAITRAEAAMSAQEYAKARSILVETLQSQPDDAYLIYNVALTHYAEGDYAKAQEFLEQADLASGDDELHSLILSQLGNIEAHEGRSAAAENKELAIDHFRRAFQIYQAALNKDSGQKIARSNQIPIRGELVTLIVNKADEQIGLAQDDRQVSDRIQKLMTTRGDLEEALQLDPDNVKAQSLYRSSEEILVENLQILGDSSLRESKAAFEEAQSEGNEKKQRSLFHKALNTVRQSENAYQDGLMLRQESDVLKNKRDEATRLSSLILMKLGEEALAEAEKQKVDQKQIQNLETAAGLFEESLQADAGNTEAQKLKTETQKKLAELFEKQGDEAVAKAEQVDKAKIEALNRETADAAYSDAAALNPDDAELQKKLDENALKLAAVLEETGNDKLEQGKSALETAPDKAVANLEDALGDLTKAAQLLEEHGEPADQTKGAMEEASDLLAQQGEEKSGEGTEPGEQPKPGDQGEPKPGEAATADKGESSDGEPGSEPGSAPGSQPGSQPGGPAMKARLAQSADAAQALLEEARALATQDPVESPGDAGGTGTPSYESVAYVTQGSDFNDEGGGGSMEREGNFNTQAMNVPARDW